MSLQYLKYELSYEVDILHVHKHESLFQGDSVIFVGFDQALIKWNEVRDVTVLVGPNITLTIYYTSSVLPPLILFIFQALPSFD